MNPVRLGGGPRLGAVVLAAGAARRFGASKLTLPWGTTTVIGAAVRSVDAALDRGAPIVVVVGGAHDDAVRAAVRTALPGSRITYVENADPSSGMLSSVQAGVRAIAGRCDAFLLCQGDQPLVAPASIASVIRHWLLPPPAQAARPRIVLPKHEGRRGHPVLFDACLIPEILGLNPDSRGLREIVWRHDAAVREVPVNDPGVTADLDTFEDYERLRPRFGSTKCFDRRNLSKYEE